MKDALPLGVLTLVTVGTTHRYASEAIVNMKLASIRLTTRNVPLLTEFYEKVTAVPPFTTPHFPGYAEIRFPTCTLALASEESASKFTAGAVVGAANRSAILEFEVSDVDAERARLEGVVKDWVMEPTDMPWATARCSSVIRTAHSSTSTSEFGEKMGKESRRADRAA
jgi:hypothetical protein